MSTGHLKHDAYFGKPGSEGFLADEGVLRSCRIDTAAVASIVTGDLIRAVYGDGGVLYSPVLVKDGRKEFLGKRVPFLIGLRDVRGRENVVQVDCLVLERAEEPILGSDVLSRLGLSVTIDYRNQAVSFAPYSWESFEQDVAELYRRLGASVRQNVNLAGFQIDLIAEEQTASRQSLRLAIECKYYREKIGNRIVNEFARVVATLKEAGLADRGVLVSHAGFSQDARLVGERTGIELLTLEDLQQAAQASQKGPAQRAVSASTAHPDSVPLAASASGNLRFFVVMPFSPELDDVYHLGIREAVRQVSASCERADEMQYTGGIVEKIYGSLKSASAVIAEVSTPNPNVYYEVGYAHALGKPVLLLTRDIESTPFDLRSYRHIVYSSIRDLKVRLTGLLEVIARTEASQEAEEGR